MKIFTALAIGLALLSLYGIKQTLLSKPESYSDRLSQIAKEVNSANGSWKAAEYKEWGSLTFESAKKMNGLIFSEKPASFETKTFSESEILNAPASFDSRQQWPNCPSIPLIRDQSSCGSCWAFGAAEAMSDRICIGSKGAKKTLVSTENLLSCCYLCGMGCNGGQLYPAWEYWKLSGLVSGGLYGDKGSCQPYSMPPCSHHVTSTKYPACPSSEYPTPKCKRTCTPESGLDYKQDKTHATHVYEVSGADRIKTEISTNGPVEGAFTVYEDFVTYKSGVYSYKTGRALGGHAIRILGYGTENGVDYWLIANSWNETWGENGYFKIRRGTNECGIENSVVTGTYSA